MNFIYRIFIASFLFVNTGLNGQVFPYIPTTFVAPYEELVDATPVVTGVWDDPEFAVPLGFDFVYFGDTSDAIYQVSLGGMMSFSPDVYGSTNNWLFAYASDLVDRGIVDDVPVSPISYKTDGVPGSRICKIEWKNVGFYEEYYGSYATTNFVNFQLWLYEGSNDIEIRFGPSDTSLGAGLHIFNGMPLIGMVENFNVDAYVYENFWYLSGPPSGPKVALSNDFGEIFSLNSLMGDPADSTVYRFSTGMTPSQEVPNLSTKIQVFPSLVSSDIQIVVQDLVVKTGQVKIFNSLGQLMLEQPLRQSGQLVDMAGFTPGLYFVSVQSEGAIFTQQVFKE